MKAITTALASWSCIGAQPLDKPQTPHGAPSAADQHTPAEVEQADAGTTQTDMPDPTLSAQTQDVLQAIKDGAVQLVQAIDAGDPARVQKVSALAPLLNALLDNGKTPLEWAVMQGKESVVGFLLKQKGIDPNKASTDGWTPLHWAADKGRVGVAIQLLKHQDIDLHATRKDGATPFYVAIAKDQLLVAIERGHTAIVQMLLDAGADPHAKGNQGRNAWDLARHYGHTAIENLLPRRAASPP